MFAAGWIDLSKTKSFWDKLDRVKTSLSQALNPPGENWQVNQVFVEEPALRFSRGGSSATTMALLQRFNGAVCTVLRGMVSGDSEFRYVNVSSARKASGVKITKSTTLTTKEQVVAQVKVHTSGKHLPWTYHKAPTGRWKGQQVVDRWCEDMADSWVVCYGGQVTGGKPW